MNSFHFDGVIPASKSHFNRALICASYASNVTLRGDSRSDDVQKMKKAISHLHDGLPFDCGSAGTVLRFLALRVSRIPGTHILKGSERLLARPQDELDAIFNQVGVHLEKKPDQLIIHGQGWKLKNHSLKVSREISSQFASAILLNAWNLDSDLVIEWDHFGVSEGYWQMSEQVVKDFGMTIALGKNSLTIAGHQKVKISSYTVESDLSSSFAIAAFAALNGQARFQQFPFQSLQPDKVFLQVLEKMGAIVETTSDSAQVSKRKESLRGVHVNLNDCPDLFPVLATLCAFANSTSRLDGAPHLIFKESNRIEKTAELLKAIGVKTQILPDGMQIMPDQPLTTQVAPFTYDTDHDHRLAFAAALVASQGFPIQIINPQVVTKSFPEFWDIVRLNF